MSHKRPAPTGGTGMVRPPGDDRTYPLTPSVYRELCNDRDVPSRAARRELLDAAFISAVSELGCPITDEAEEAFQRRVDTYYRTELMARRAVVRDDVSVRLRAVLLEQRAAAYRSQLMRDMREEKESHR